MVSSNKAVARRRLPVRVAEAMTAVLDYLWHDQARDWLARSEHEQETHIFAAMLTVRQWLKEQRQSESRKNKP